MLDIEIAYAPVGAQYLIALQVACGTTARQAVLQSELPQRFQDVDFTTLPLGIFGKIVADATVLQSGDRIELYRPLIIDPKENRRRRHERDKQSA